MNPFISYIVPVYNAEPYLKACLESLIEQIQDSEIILVDDGSTDGSGLLCDHFTVKYPFISVIHTPNRGVSAARNRAIEIAKGQYLICLDADDYWRTNQFEIIRAAIFQHPETDIFMADYLILDQNTGSLTPLDPHRSCGLSDPVDGLTCLLAILKSDPHFGISPCRFCVRRSYLENQNIRFKEDLYFEDVLWVNQILIAAKSVQYLPTAWYVYRQNLSDQITANLTPKKIRDRIWISATWLKEAERLSFKEPFKTLFLGRTGELYFTSVIRFKAVCDKTEAKAVLSELKANKAILNYPNTPTNHAIALVARVFGLSFAGSLFGALFELKSTPK